jgi:hypothetical protein
MASMTIATARWRKGRYPGTFTATSSRHRHLIESEGSLTLPLGGLPTVPTGRWTADLEMELGDHRLIKARW